MSKINAKTKQEPISGVDALVSVEQTAIDAVAKTYTSMFGNIVRAQAEVLRFLSDRFGKDAQMFSLFAACKSPADIAQLQLQLGSGVVEDYMIETQRMLGLFERAADENLAQTS